MRVVLDTNVLLAGLFTRGICESLLDLCLASDLGVTVVASEHILTEFANHAGDKFGVPAERVAEATDRLRRRMEIVAPVEVTPDACRDPDDLPVLGTMLAGKAACLVTGDRDLLAVKSFQGAAILSPRDFYDRIRVGS